MNYEHVLWHKRNANWVIAESEDVPRLFCDGCIICLAGELDLGTRAENAERMVKGMQSLWRNAPTVPPLFLPRIGRGLSGIEIHRNQLAGVDPILRRFLIAPEIFIFLKERYVRCFDEDASFHGTAADKQVMVYEKGSLAGIVMPVRVSYEDEAILWGTRVPDRIIFHECAGSEDE